MRHRISLAKFGVCAALAAVAALLPSSLEAQSNEVGSVLKRMIPEAVGFAEGENEALRGLISAQSTTFPVGSSAGGFTWTFDRQLGMPTRRSRTFGPMFAERPLTTGRHRLNISLAFQRTQWKSLAGFQLDEGLPFITDDFYESERIEQRGIVHLTTEQAVVNASFGVLENLDIGVIVPYLRQTVSGEQRRFCTDVFSSRSFCDIKESHAGESSGIGDVTLRGKFVFPSRQVEFATAVDVRLPTGDEMNLLGAGRVQTTVMALGGGRTGRIAPHFNIGYTFGGGGLPDPGSFRFEQGDFRPSDEFKYTVGAEFFASGNVTLAADIVGRTMFNAPNPYFGARSFGGYATSGLRISRDTLNLLLGAVSAKFMVANSWLLTTAVAFPLNSNGLKPGLTPVIGFERAF